MFRFFTLYVSALGLVLVFVFGNESFASMHCHAQGIKASLVVDQSQPPLSRLAISYRGKTETFLLQESDRFPAVMFYNLVYPNGQPVGTSRDALGKHLAFISFNYEKDIGFEGLSPFSGYTFSCR